MSLDNTPNLKPALLVMIDEKGNPRWEANLPLPWINLLLDRIKLDILTGKFQQGPQLATPTPWDVAAVRRPPPNGLVGT